MWRKMHREKHWTNSHDGQATHDADEAESIWFSRAFIRCTLCILWLNC